MSYTLHYAQHFAPEWKGGMFAGRDQQWLDLFYDRFHDHDDSWHNDSEDEFEVARESIEAYITELKALDQDAPNRFFGAHLDEPALTNAQVIIAMQDILRSDDLIIRLEWF